VHERHEHLDTPESLLLQVVVLGVDGDELPHAPLLLGDLLVDLEACVRSLGVDRYKEPIRVRLLEVLGLVGGDRAVVDKLGPLIEADERHVRVGTDGDVVGEE